MLSLILLLIIILLVMNFICSLIDSIHLARIDNKLKRIENHLYGD